MDDSSFIRKLQSKKMQGSTLVLDSVCPTTRLLEKRRQLFEVSEALEAQKEEFARKEEILKRRENNLKKKDLQLQESLVRFSKFLQENDAKKARAEKKAAEELKAQQQKEKEIKQHLKTIEALKEEKIRSSLILDKYSKYHKYLESVVDASEEFQEISEVLRRYKTLKMTNEDLLLQKEALNRATSDTEGKLRHCLNDRQDEVVALTNRLSQIKRRIEAIDTESSTQQLKTESEMALAAQETLEHGQFLMATQNLFQRCCENSILAHSQSLSPPDQLDVVGHFVADLDSIVNSI